MSTSDHPIPAFTPRSGSGRQFVFYGDACSGRPGHRHAANLAANNNVITRLDPAPEWIAFPGDEISGLTTDAGELRRQWRYFLDVEMAGITALGVPIYHTTGNHTTYDVASERVFREALPHLPRNGPPGQDGLSYIAREGDVLLIVINTMSTALGEGRVDIAWVDAALDHHRDAPVKLIMGHHPIWPVNGFAGDFQRDICHEDGERLHWLMVEHGVTAYLCSHILAFDAQVHDGVLQLLSAGAGTHHRMPDGVEYLHAVQIAIDDDRLRYQVLDTAGTVREWASWPPQLPPEEDWSPLDTNVDAPFWRHTDPGADSHRIPAWQFRGATARSASGSQTLLTGWNDGDSLPPLWIGLIGPEQRLSVLLSPLEGRSPHLWHGPTMAAGQPFDLQIVLHPGMGPGGLLWRSGNAAPWSSLTGTSPWGAEQLPNIAHRSIGHDRGDPDARPFLGRDLTMSGTVVESHRFEPA